MSSCGGEIPRSSGSAGSMRSVAGSSRAPLSSTTVGRTPRAEPLTPVGPSAGDWPAGINSVASRSIGRLLSILSLASCTWVLAKTATPVNLRTRTATPPRAAFRRWLPPSIIPPSPPTATSPRAGNGRGEVHCDGCTLLKVAGSLGRIRAVTALRARSIGPSKTRGRTTPGPFSPRTRQRPSPLRPRSAERSSE